jgi:hypothetical protein
VWCETQAGAPPAHRRTRCRHIRTVHCSSLDYIRIEIQGIDINRLSLRKKAAGLARLAVYSFRGHLTKAICFSLQLVGY